MKFEDINEDQLTDWSEMRWIADNAKGAGFNSVTVDPAHVIELIDAVFLLNSLVRELDKEVKGLQAQKEDAYGMGYQAATKAFYQE